MSTITFSNAFSPQIAQNVAYERPLPSSSSLPYVQFTSSSGGSSTTSAQHNGAQSSLLTSLKKAVNSKRDPEELEIMRETAERFNARLAQDQEAVLHPDVDSPFVDEVDVVNRLLPYHMFQQPRDDLETLIFGKGKQKAVDHLLDEEILETKFALECHQRRADILKRWRRLQIRSGKRAVPDDQAYYLAQIVLDADRSENAWLTNELRSGRSEVERIEREKRAAANAARLSQFSTTPQTILPTMQAQYYRAYPYAYTQAYGSTISPAAPAPTITTFSVSPAPAPAPVTPTTPSANYAPYQPGDPIPVQLPVASLPALHALGIIPVPHASLPPEGQPQPPAVLRGSTANGTILNLEINVSLLQNTQMSGLALVLNSLVARTNQAAAAAANAATNASAAMTAYHSPSISRTDANPS